MYINNFIIGFLYTPINLSPDMISNGKKTKVAIPNQPFIRLFAISAPIDPPLFVISEELADASIKLWSAYPLTKNEIRLIIKYIVNNIMIIPIDALTLSFSKKSLISFIEKLLLEFFFS